MAFITDSINLSSLAFWRRPDRLDALATLRAEHPVSWHEFTEPPEQGMKGFWAVLRHADVVAVSTDSKTFFLRLKGSVPAAAAFHGWPGSGFWMGCGR